MASRREVLKKALEQQMKGLARYEAEIERCENEIDDLNVEIEEAQTDAMPYRAEVKRLRRLLAQEPETTTGGGR